MARLCRRCGAVRVFLKEDLRFREVERKDLELLRLHRNEPDTWKNLTSCWPIYDQEAWFSSLGKGRLAFVVENHVTAVGFARLDEIDQANRSIRVGCDVFRGFRGQGYGKRIMRGLVSWCFEELGMHRVWLLVLDSNEVARRVYENVGFKHEGLQKEAVWRNGRWHDYVMMGILESE